MRGVAHPEEAVRVIREFLSNPDAQGLILHVRDPGVDVAVNVVAERAGAYVWTCQRCDHLARHGDQPKLPVICPLCGAPGPTSFQFRGDKPFRTYAWVVRWSRAGMEGVGLGGIIDHGRFSDAWILAGVRRIKDVLTVEIRAMEEANVTSVRDLHWLRMSEQQDSRNALDRGVGF